MTSLNLKLKKSEALAVLFLLVLYSCVSAPKVKISSENPAEVFVEIANTPDEQFRGLMFRERLDKNEGMLFVFADGQPRTFWMKNTKIPLDIIFISGDKKVVDIKQDFQPCKSSVCETYTSRPAQYALEVNAGFINEHRIKIGDSVSLAV